MSTKLTDLIEFRGDRLFNGAVNIDWFDNSPEKTKEACAAFVFHGPKYHGVKQEDVGSGHGHRLTDTASFARDIIKRCYGLDDKPFTLAIAGYGTGKSHFGITLANLLTDYKGKTAQKTLAEISTADSEVGDEVKKILEKADRPCLVLALNGMRTFDLTAEVLKQLLNRLKADGHNIKVFEKFRQRFTQAIKLIGTAKEGLVQELLDKCEISKREDLIQALEQQDELVYKKVHDFFSANGISISALGGESVRDIVEAVSKEYCGKGKPYRSLLILFDEFGKYTEFATIKPQIAGGGVLQELFEVVQQANDSSICFVGFIQFELNAYTQRIAPEYRNEILRYISRYQSAEKAYLSINLETLIANLLEKKQEKLLEKWFDGNEAKVESGEILSSLSGWFPQAKNHRLWGDPLQFHKVIRKGCWPLSPYSTWFLFHLASAGKHLQGRSALALLSDAIQQHQNIEVSEKTSWSMPPTSLWSEALQQELITAEETGQQGSITHAYTSVMARHGAHLSKDQQGILRAVVLASKLGLKAKSKDDATEAIARLSGLSDAGALDGISKLQDEYNVLEWDDAFKSFDILGDAVPRTEFLKFLKQRIASQYSDELAKGRIFASKAQTWCPAMLGDLSCDFAEENKISTQEWRYQGVTSNLDFLPQQIKIAADRWRDALSVDTPRGTIIYTYVDQDQNLSSATEEGKRLLKAAAKEVKAAALPILIVFITDEDGKLGQVLAELAVLDDSISNEDRVRYGNLINLHKEKAQKTLESQIEDLIKERNYLTGVQGELESSRLGAVGSEIFSQIYPTPIQFPFDGFNTAKGNAADTVQEFTKELLIGKLDYQGIMAKPAKSKNRAVSVLKNSWGVFNKNGDIIKRPTLSILKKITEGWDESLEKSDKELPIDSALQALCLPPYGANIASAGLFLGVFIAARNENLAIARDGEQLAVSKWMEDIFAGKFIDISATKGASLVLIGEESSEWQKFLDEWEMAESHIERKKYLEKSAALRRRLPVPPALNYQATSLSETAAASIDAIERMDESQNNALMKVEKSRQNRNIGVMIWGAADLKKIYNRMKSEGPLWTPEQLEEIAPHIEDAREEIRDKFGMWILNQAPRTDTPEAIGEFKHHMIHQTGGGLKVLGLEEEYTRLEQRTKDATKKAEIIVGARQVGRDIDSWVMQHTDILRNPKMSVLRGLISAGEAFVEKLSEFSQQLKDDLTIAEFQARLKQFGSKLKTAREDLEKRAENILNSKISSREDIDKLLAEVESLESAFENLPTDLEDFRLMRKALNIYVKCFQRLEEEKLTWDSFKTLAKELKDECKTELGKEELPWSYEETIEMAVKSVSGTRMERSSKWLKDIESQKKAISKMTVAEANNLYSQIEKPPSFVTSEDLKSATAIKDKLEIRLDALAVEWLIEKYKSLSKQAKKEFLNELKDIAP